MLKRGSTTIKRSSSRRTIVGRTGIAGFYGAPDQKRVRLKEYRMQAECTGCPGPLVIPSELKVNQVAKSYLRLAK